MLLWSILYLTGTQAVNAEYETVGEPAVTLDDINRFRQLGSKAPGHPEYHLVSGVETTTGPLGQGIATSVGMAIAQRWPAARYNKPEFPIFDYDIYTVCGDGCLMERVGSEAASLAGHLGDKVGGPPVAAEQLFQFLAGDSRKERRVGNLVAVEMQDRQHRAVGGRIEELVRMPRGGEWPRLRLAVAHDAGRDEIGVVEHGTERMAERVA